VIVECIDVMPVTSLNEPVGSSQRPPPCPAKGLDRLFERTLVGDADFSVGVIASGSGRFNTSTEETSKRG
jgi:hypothetical protein